MPNNVLSLRHINCTDLILDPEATKQAGTLCVRGLPWRHSANCHQGDNYTPPLLI